MSAFKVGDKVVAKVRGFPYWPAKVTKVQGKAVEVFFYGTGEKGKVNSSNVKLYSDLKAPFKTKRQSLMIAVHELEEEISEEQNDEPQSAENIGSVGSTDSKDNASRNVETKIKPKRRKGLKQTEDQPDPEVLQAENVDSLNPSGSKNQKSNVSQSVDSTIKRKRRIGIKQTEDQPNVDEKEAENVDSVHPNGSKTQESNVSQSVNSTIKRNRRKGIKQAEDQPNAEEQGAENVDSVHPSDSENQESNAPQNVESTVKPKRRKGIKQAQDQPNLETQGDKNINSVHTSGSKNESNVSQSVDSTIKRNRRKGIKQAEDQPTSFGAENVDPSNAKTQESSQDSMSRPKRKRATKQYQPTSARLVDQNVDAVHSSTSEIQDLSKSRRKRVMKHDQPSGSSDLGQPSEPIYVIPESSSDPILVEDEHEQAEIDPRASQVVTSINGKSADKLVSKTEDVVIIEESQMQKATKSQSNQDERKLKVSYSRNTAETSKTEGIKRSARQISKPKKLVEENGPKPKIISQVERTLMEVNYALIEHFKYEDHEITKAISILNDLSNLKLSKEILKKQFHIVLTIKQLTMYYGKKSQQSRVLRNTATFVFNQLMQYFSNDEDPKETYLREAQEYQSSILAP